MQNRTGTPKISIKNLGENETSPIICPINVNGNIIDIILNRIEEKYTNLLA